MPESKSRFFWPTCVCSTLRWYATAMDSACFSKPSSSKFDGSIGGLCRSVTVPLILPGHRRRKHARPILPHEKGYLYNQQLARHRQPTTQHFWSLIAACDAHSDPAIRRQRRAAGFDSWFSMSYTNPLLHVSVGYLQQWGTATWHLTYLGYSSPGHSSPGLY